jgi:uncharacterized protein YjbI with pentapeptide repeats
MQNPAALNTTLRPLTYADPMYQLLRDGDVAEFNRRKAAGQTCDLTHCDLRSLDLRGIDAGGLDFSHCYFRNANLRGVDFTKSCLEGASLNAAKIAGAYFPAELSAQEIALSVKHGARMRYSTER